MASKSGVFLGGGIWSTSPSSSGSNPAEIELADAPVALTATRFALRSRCEILRRNSKSDFRFARGIPHFALRFPSEFRRSRGTQASKRFAEVPAWHRRCFSRLPRKSRRECQRTFCKKLWRLNDFISNRRRFHSYARSGVQFPPPPQPPTPKQWLRARCRARGEAFGRQKAAVRPAQSRTKRDRVPVTAHLLSQPSCRSTHSPEAIERRR
eukprot:scaffold66_cov233-Pinguiococcus_pyrenoidosus.AAC.6